MLVFRQFGRSGRLVLLLSLFLCLVFTQMGWLVTAQAVALPMVTSRDSELVSHIETLRPVSHEAKTPVALLYCPGFTWAALNEQDASQSPVLFNLLDASAIGNLSASQEWMISALDEASHVGLYTLESKDSLESCAQEIDRFITEDLPDNGLLVIVSSPLFAGSPTDFTFTPILVFGEGFRGYLTSERTHRTGLVHAYDLGLFAAGLDGQDPSTDTSAQVSSSLLKSQSTSDKSLVRVHRLQDAWITQESITATKEPASFAFLTLVFIAFALAIILFSIGRRKMPGTRGVLIPAVRILWLVVLSYPPATFLMFTLLPALPSAFDLTIACIIWVAVISIAALLVGWRTKWVNSLIALFALSILILVIGQFFGGPLNTPGYLTYDITEGARFYGMGNEQGAILFGSWITLSGLLINRYPDARGIPFFKRWGFPLGSVFLLFVATSPWLGASFGPLVWGFLGCFFSWWAFNGKRVRLWLIVIMLVAAAVLALGVLYFDIALNPASHMSYVKPSMSEGFIALILRIGTQLWTYSFSLITQYVPAVIIVFIAFVFVLLVVLRVLQPGSYREFWQRNTAFRAVYSVCFVLAAITFVLEDSGVFTPAILLIYPVSCFVWLVCDLHSWHLRILAEGGIPITLHELQQRAMELLVHENAKRGAEEVSPAQQDEGNVEYLQEPANTGNPEDPYDKGQ